VLKAIAEAIASHREFLDGISWERHADLVRSAFVELGSLSMTKLTLPPALVAAIVVTTRERPKGNLLATRWQTQQVSLPPGDSTCCDNKLGSLAKVNATLAE